MPTLVYKRYRGDAIEAFKYLKGIYSVDCSSMLPLHEDNGMRTRGHSLKLMKRNCRSQLRRNLFGLRIVEIWNGLADEVVEAPSVNCFKGRFDIDTVTNRFSMEWKNKTQEKITKWDST